MKTIGIIGGMSYTSTIEYYRIINEIINKKLGGLHSAKMLIESYDFSEIEKRQIAGDWEGLKNILTKSAKKLESQGADYIAIATNTMHILAEDIQKEISIPIIHIAEAAALDIKNKNLNTVLLLGTRYTMTKPFYKDILINKFGINVIVPDDEDMTTVHNIIFKELCKDIIKDESREKLNQIINKYKSKGAQAVILGCTELPNIIHHAEIDIIDTTKVHCYNIVEKILS